VYQGVKQGCDNYDAVPFTGLKEMQIIKVVCRGERPPRLEVPSLSDGAWKLMQDCWEKEKVTRPGIEDVVKRMMIGETLRGSAPTQHRSVKHERALSNGLSDVALPTVTASKSPLSPPMTFDPGWTINVRVSPLFTLTNFEPSPEYIPAVPCLDFLSVFPWFYVVIYNGP